MELNFVEHSSTTFVILSIKMNGWPLQLPRQETEYQGISHHLIMK